MRRRGNQQAGKGGEEEYMLLLAAPTANDALKAGRAKALSKPGGSERLPGQGISDACG